MVGAAESNLGRAGDGIIVHTERISALQCLLEDNYVLAGVETGDADCANRTRHRLVKYEAILICADGYCVSKPHMNGVVAVADRYRISAKGKYHVIVAVSQRYRVVGAAANKHLIIVAIARLDYVP